jgi:hypothetical protein
MAESNKFVYLMILFICFFLVVIDVNGKQFLFYPFELSCYLIQNNLSFNIYFLIVLYITAQRRPRCKENSDCSEFPCVLPMVPQCVAFKCRCRLN